MKSKLLIISILILLFGEGYAQDLIVMKNGDSLNCFIDKKKDGNIYFVIKQEWGALHNMVPSSDVVVKRNFYRKRALSSRELNAILYSPLRVAVSGGYSCLATSTIDDISSELKDYYRDMKNGSNYGCDVTYYFSKSYGVGLKYRLFRNKSSIDNIMLGFSNGEVVTGLIVNNISTHFIAPTFSMRFLNRSRKNALILDFSVGYVGYINDGKVVNPIKLTGKTIGMSLGWGYDFSISNKLSLGVQMSIFTASLREFSYDDGNTTGTLELGEDQDESLARFDLSFGLSYNL